jgi:hypothetical protein
MILCTHDTPPAILLELNPCGPPCSVPASQNVFVRRAEDPAPAPLYARFAKWAKAPEVAKGGSASGGKGEGSVEEEEEEGTLVRVVPALTGALAPSTHERHGKGCRGERLAGMYTFALDSPPPPPSLVSATVGSHSRRQRSCAGRRCASVMLLSGDVVEGTVCESAHLRYARPLAVPPITTESGWHVLPCSNPLFTVQ